MKKNIVVIAGIAILALTVGTCTLFDNPTDAVKARPIEYDEFGRQVVELNIFTGDSKPSRNMSLDTAMVGINYYEVMFGEYAATANPPAGNPTRLVRTAGPRGKTLTVRLPVGFNLAHAQRAIVFGGNLDRATDERTLLATGIVTDTNWDASAGTGDPIAGQQSVQANTTSIRFLLYPVDTHFAQSSTASFQITEATPSTQGTSTSDSRPYTTGLTASHNSIEVEGTGNQLNHQSNMDNGDIYPYWKLPKTVGAVTATAKATFSYGLPTEHLDAIRADFVNVKFDSYGIFTGYKEDGVTAVTAVPDTTGTNVPLPPLIPLTITMMKEPLNQGFCVLILNIPVRAITTADSIVNHEWWTLKNGMYDYEIHDNNLLGDPQGTLPFPLLTPNPTGVSLGGALMLCVGEPVSAGSGRPILIIIDGPGYVAP